MSSKSPIETLKDAHAAQLISVYWFGRFDQYAALVGSMSEPLVTQPEFRAAAQGRGWSEFGAIYDRLVAAKMQEAL